ncbi:hypothetical protein J5N97_009969, partial [Dioscorea zingiberensis]
ILGTTLEDLVEEFDRGLEPQTGGEYYSKKLVEFCSLKAIEKLCCIIGEKITDESFSRLTFDMMLAWENPSCSNEHESSHSENIAKEKEDRKETIEDDVSLFYSDIMPLLVDEEKSVGEDAFVWLASLLPVVADVVNARFTFEAMTASTAYCLHYPAYDRFLKEIDKCIKYLQKQAPPTGFDLGDDEYILHIEGTARTQRVVRHIGGTSWPGRLTLTNLALYFETSGVISYETALKLDLSKPDLDHQVKPASTGPWGAPLFDKAITCDSSDLSEPVVLEFPEMTSSTRRDLWLTLVKEVILLHRFMWSFKITSPAQSWEMQARTGLGVFRLHAAREMLRISPPTPSSFLIFSLFDELPKGDYVLEELCNTLKQLDGVHQCSAASILKSLNMAHPIDVLCAEAKESIGDQPSNQADSLASLDMTVNQAREEAREVSVAKATVESRKEEGIADSFLVLAELLSPLKDVLPCLQDILTWKRPAISGLVFSGSLIVIYKEWVGFAIAVFLFSLVGMMLWARREKISHKPPEIVVSTSSDKTTMESVVAAQHSLRSVHEMVKTVNITILKIRSILEFRAPRQANQVMLPMTGMAMVLIVIPFKFILIAIVIATFITASKARKSTSSSQGHRRLREWWESIPIVPIRTVNTPI